MADKLKGSPWEIKGEIPDGIPVSSTVTTAFIPFRIPASMPPEQAAQIREKDAKAKPLIRQMKVTKIEVKDLPADTFAKPADYKQASLAGAAASTAPAKPAAKPRPLTECDFARPPRIDETASRVIG